MKFQLTGYVQLGGVSNPTATDTIRTTIEAENRQEAEEKFKAFLLKKAQAVIKDCQPVKLQDDSEQRLFQAIRDIFNK